MTNHEREVERNGNERRTASRVRSASQLTYQRVRAVRDDVRQRTDENDPVLLGLVEATHMAFRQLTLAEAALANDRGITSALTFAARNSKRLVTLIDLIITFDREAGASERREGAKA